MTLIRLAANKHRPFAPNGNGKVLTLPVVFFFTETENLRLHVITFLRISKKTYNPHLAVTNSNDSAVALTPSLTQNKHGVRKKKLVLIYVS